MNNKLLISDFLQFLKKPNLEGLSISKSEKVIRTVRLWIISLISIILLRGIAEKIVEIPLPDMFEDFFDNIGVWGFVGFVVILGPLLEEITFRSALRFRVSYLLISFILITVYVLSIIMRENESLVLGFGIVAVLLFAALVYALSQKPIESKAFYTRYYPYVFYFIAILFGYIHIGNFEEFSLKLLLLSPLIVLPQFILGVSLGYIRVRFGFWYAVFFHVLNNGIMTALFFSGGGFIE